MKLTAVFGIAVLAGALDGQTITVYLDNHSQAPQLVTTMARLQAGKMFSTIGLNVVWRSGVPVASGNAAPAPLIVTLTDRTPEDFHPGELAAALPFEGTHIAILYDRLTQLNPPPNQAAILLAYVIAHEITHMLQGTNQHSVRGVMRARWTHDDYIAMQRRELRFEPFDIELLRHGLAARH